VDILRNFRLATLKKKMFTRTTEINNADKIIAAGD